MSTTAKEYLMQIRFMGQEIRAVEYQIFHLQRELLTPPGGGHLTAAISPDGVHAGKSYAWSEDNINEYLRLIAMQEKLVASRTRTRKKIIGEIESVADPRYRVLLYDRYVNLLSWRQIAKHMGYSEDHVRHDLHSNALQAFDKKRGH